MDFSFKINIGFLVDGLACVRLFIYINGNGRLWILDYFSSLWNMKILLEVDS